MQAHTKNRVIFWGLVALDAVIFVAVISYVMVTEGELSFAALYRVLEKLRSGLIDVLTTMYAYIGVSQPTAGSLGHGTSYVIEGIILLLLLVYGYRATRSEIKKVGSQNR